MKKKLFFVVLIGFLSVSTTSFACGPEYDYDSDLEISLEFDPAKNESPYFKDVMRALGYEQSYYRRVSEGSYTADLNKITWDAKRNVEFVMTGKEYDPEALRARCPLMMQYDVSREFDKLYYSKMIILEMSANGGSFRYKRHEWDAVPENMQKGKGFYTEWLSEKVRTGSTYCQFSQEYYPQIKDRVGVREYVSPRDDDLFEQLRGHPELSNYSALVEASVFIHEKNFTAAKKLITTVLSQSKDQFEIDTANALAKIQPAPAHDKERYVIDDVSSSLYSWGTCASNTRENALTFIRSAADDKSLTDEAYRELVGWRTAMLKLCNKAEVPTGLLDGPAHANPHIFYLRAVSDFYSGKYDEAAEKFSVAGNTSNLWIAETSKYLEARSLLLAGQNNWRMHTDLPEINRSMLDSAYAAYDAYMKIYPDGRYADSARGMLRRVHYLKGDKYKYKQMLIDEINEDIKQLSTKEKLEQDDREKFFSLVNEYRLRSGDTTLQTFVVLNDALNDQKINNSEFHDFASEIDYLLSALNAYKQNQVTFFEKNIKRTTKLRQFHGVIAARAFENAARFTDANKQWNDVKSLLEHPSDSDLSIAANIMRKGTLVDLLQSQYEIRDDIISGYISAQCNEDDDKSLLKTKLARHTRAIVVQDLAMRKLTNGDLSGVHAMFKVHSNAEMGDMAAIQTAVEMVATGSNKGKGYMNIGYYLAKRGAPYTDTSIHESYRKAAESGCHQTGRPEGSYSYFLKALNEFATTSTEDEAKTLHFLVMCSKPSGGNRLRCWGSGEQKPSKVWFDKLHSKYPNSKWAKKTPYFYD